MTTLSDLTTTARKHIIKAIKTGLGINSYEAHQVLSSTANFHIPFIEKGEDLRGIQAIVRKDTPAGAEEAFFNLYLNDKWKGTFRTSGVRVRRRHPIDEAMDEAMAMCVPLAANDHGPSAIANERNEREANGRAGDLQGVIVSISEHPEDADCLTVVVRNDDGEDVTFVYIPLPWNTMQESCKYLAECIGERRRIIWTRAPEYGADYNTDLQRIVTLGDAMVIDFIMAARSVRRAA